MKSFKGVFLAQKSGWEDGDRLWVEASVYRGEEQYAIIVTAHAKYQVTGARTNTRLMLCDTPAEVLHTLEGIDRLGREVLAAAAEADQDLAALLGKEEE